MASNQWLKTKILALGVLFYALSSSSIAVCSAHLSDGSSQDEPPFMIGMMGVLNDWLHRLHSLLVEDPMPEREKDTPNDSSRPVEPTHPAEPVTTAPRAAARGRRGAEQESQPFMIRMMGVLKDSGCIAFSRCLSRSQASRPSRLQAHLESTS